MKARGRPRTSNITRVEQLRIGKRAHRARQRKAGIQTVQLELIGETAAKLKVARLDRDFETALDALLDRLVIRIADYPQLRDLAWNRRGDLMAAREAFQLYERNWRLVDVGRLDAHERALIDRLTETFGGGLFNA